MAKGISRNWIKNMKEMIRKNEFVSVTITYNPAAQWIIKYLSDKGEPVVVVNLGAGVKRITLADNVCSACSGLGFTK